MWTVCLLSLIHILSFLNLAASEETFANSISIPPQRDAFDSIREEYTTMLQNQLARGNNGLIKTKYLTFGIDADSIKAAKPRLERIETDILNNFKRLGVAARTLDGKERLSQLHAVFHMDEQLPFQFEWDWLAPVSYTHLDVYKRQQHRKGHVLPDVGRYALQRAGGRERNPVCLLPCHRHCRSPVPQLYDGQAFFE